MNSEKFPFTPEEEAAREINPELSESKEVRSYPEEFSRALEQGTGEFILEHFLDARMVQMANEKDDQGRRYYHQPGFDLVVGWGKEKEEVKIAVDVSISEDSSQTFKKMKMRRDLDSSIDFSGKRPVVDIHDESGKVISEKVPFASLLYGEKATEEWKNAFSAWLESGQKGRVIDWIKDQTAIKVNIIVSLTAAIEESMQSFPEYRSRLAPIREVLSAKIAELKEEAAGRPGGARSAHGMIRHQVLDHGTKRNYRDPFPRSPLQ